MTATTTPPEKLEPTPPSPRRRREIDPEHDIDAKKTLTWLIFWTISIFISLWLLLQLFKVVIFRERQDKVEATQPITLDDLRDQEEALLRGGPQADGSQRMSIEEAMREVVERRGR